MIVCTSHHSRGRQRQRDYLHVVDVDEFFVLLGDLLLLVVVDHPVRDEADNGGAGEGAEHGAGDGAHADLVVILLREWASAQAVAFTRARWGVLRVAPFAGAAIETNFKNRIECVGIEKLSSSPA